MSIQFSNPKVSYMYNFFTWESKALLYDNKISNILPHLSSILKLSLSVGGGCCLVRLLIWKIQIHYRDRYYIVSTTVAVWLSSSVLYALYLLKIFKWALNTDKYVRYWNYHYAITAVNIISVTKSYQLSTTTLDYLNFSGCSHWQSDYSKYTILRTILYLWRSSVLGYNNNDLGFRD